MLNLYTTVLHEKNHKQCIYAIAHTKVFKKSFFESLMTSLYALLSEDCCLIIALFLPSVKNFVVLSMPPKTKKRKVTSEVLERARKQIQARPAKAQPVKEPEMMNDLLNTSQEAANTEDELIDPSFDLDSCNTSHQMEEFNEEWVAQLPRDDKFSLAMFLHHHLTVTMVKGDTEASELMMYKSDRTI